MRVIPKDKVIFSFNAEHPCQYSVEDGETFWVETDDCYSGQITDASISRSWTALLGRSRCGVPSREIPCVWRSWPLSSADRGLW